jgi:tryptophan synthase alpha chain
MRAIQKVFADLRRLRKKAFIPFITAGDPDLESTVRLVPELERAGASVVELGVPFSDPLADGPVIQRASERARRHRYRLLDYLEAVRTVRAASEVPIVLFSYFNPLLQYGLDRLAQDARQAGVDGLLVTDMTPEESDEYRKCLRRHDLDSIFLAAPTSGSDRIRRIAECSSGFVYVVSRTGVTGARESLSQSVGPTVEVVRAHCDLPVAVGFGISNPEQVRAVWELADGAVVGSAIVSAIEQHGAAPGLEKRISEFCRWLVGSPSA